MLTLQQLTDHNLRIISEIVDNDNNHGISNVGATLGNLLRRESVPSGVEFFAIYSGNDFVGVRYTRPHNEGVETGVWILPSQRKRGYATYSLKALIEMIRTEYACVGYKKIFIYVDKAKNPHACNPAIKCGFTEKGIAENDNGSQFAIFFLQLI